MLVSCVGENVGVSEWETYVLHQFEIPVSILVIVLSNSVWIMWPDTVYQCILNS